MGSNPSRDADLFLYISSGLSGVLIPETRGLPDVYQQN
jgi:hypothetical protein